MENKNLHVVIVAAKVLVICLVVAALTALVYAITKIPIEEGERGRKEDAIRGIFAETDSYEERNDVTGDGVNAVFTVKNAAGEVIGWCVDYTGRSDYGGDVAMMIGVTPANGICGVQVINHSETFIDRYLDGENRYTGVAAARGSDISAGATLSYNAIRNAMEAVTGLSLGGAQ